MESKKRTGTDFRQPVRVVFDRQARLPLDSQLMLTFDRSPLLVVVSPEADPSRTASLRDAGAEVLVADGIEAALADLGRRNITSLFLEGGQTLAAAFQTVDQLDQARTFIAPILLGAGGQDATRAGGAGDGGVEDGPWPARSAPPSPTTGPARLQHLSHTTETIGDDTLITARFKEW
jgi:diaminohydroxyphosphoribosylaminopyrimidine deaminase/5-amino-6-(5-phosphoribosylamino)uracil reductase